MNENLFYAQVTKCQADVGTGSFYNENRMIITKSLAKNNRVLQSENYP